MVSETNIQPSPHFFRENGQLEGQQVVRSTRTIGQLKHIFHNEAARAAMPPSTMVYQVEAYMPIPGGTEGGLFFGTTTISPGMVDDEYFMTQGHFHEKGNRTEYYWCLQGEGMLLLMEKDRTCRSQRMLPNTLHYIPAHTGHRVINIGKENLIFSACWPSDAGYDYDVILRDGFSQRVICRDGQPSVIQL